MLEFSDHAISLLENYYMMEGDTTPLDAFKRASQAFSAGDKELADRILSYVENGWFMFSSPILSNARLEGQKKSGLPISCFLTYVDDSLEGLISHSEELRWMSVLGGGVGGHWSNVRSVSDKAPGPIPFIKTIDSDVEAYRQGKCYHPDVEILTENGWVRFSDLKEGVKVAQVGDALDISFVIPTELIKEHHDGSLIRVYDGTNVDVLVTPNHSMVVDMGYGLTKVRADELLCNQEVRMFKEDGNHFTTQAIKKEEVPYNGLVYCALVPTGRLLVRSNGRSLICGNTRKGSYAAYMDISHPDIIEFLNIRVPTGGDTNRKCFNLNNAVNLSDDFMNAVVEGKEWNLIDPHTKQVKETLQARDLWQRILEVRFRTGEPYFFFSDTANKHLPQSLKDKGLKIHGSNLCMAGSDRVVTSRGYLTAQELHEQGGELEVFDGVSMQKSTAMQLIEKDVPTYKITLKNGLSHTVTGYHKIKTDNGETPCQDLKVGDRVHIQSNKGLFGTTSMEDEAFLLGLYQADGTQHKDIIMLDIWEDDFDLIDEIEERFARVHHKYGYDTYEITNQHGGVYTRGREPAKFTTCTVNQSTVAKKRLASKTLKKALDFTKGQVPYWIWESDEATQWQYVRGLFYADGCVSLASSRGEPIYLSISNVNKDFLNDLHILLRNLGLPFTLHLQREAGYSSLPDGKGGYKDYPTQTSYRLVCGSKNACLLFEEKTSFLTRRGVSIENRKWRDNSRKVSEIVSIEYVGHQDVYCLTVESEAHCFVANGFITLNCNEIFLATSKDRSAVCCLSSLNLEYFDEWKDTSIVEDCITFLDNVLQYFIDNAPQPQMKRAIYSAIQERSLGLGAMGFHSYLQRKNIAFESAIAKSVNMRIFRTIKERAVKQTETLAKTRGECLDGVGTGRRNSHLLAIAPNANSAIILDTSPSIEPWKSNAFTHRTRAGSFLSKNKFCTTPRLFN